jgi:hypothetical protein
MLFKVKPLEWKADTWAQCTTMTADVPFGWITIRRDDFDRWSVWFKSDLPSGPVHRTLDEAKTAAEQWYTAMLMEALEPATMEDIYAYERQDEACAGTSQASKQSEEM